MGSSNTLLSSFTHNLVEAGCDEAGRGCLAGPVVAAAVIFPKNYTHPVLTDSKQLSENQRFSLREVICKDALAWAVAFVDNATIDKINILNASFLAMHKAIDQLGITPQLLLIDGNRFKEYKAIRHQCVVKGDEKYLSIAAASVLAKTYRDEYMNKIHAEYPVYHWQRNKGYPTADHRKGIMQSGISPYHRKSFRLLSG